jgi:hypothetical protein
MHLPTDNDPLEEWLGKPSGARDALRARMLQETTRQIRRRRRVRQAAKLTALAAAVLAAVIVYFAWPTPKDQPVVRSREEEKPPAAPTALAQEWRAVDAGSDRSEQYLKAGDRYLHEENNPAAALRCYSQALDAASQQDIDFSPQDNWLVMALKDARRKERAYGIVNP